MILRYVIILASLLCVVQSKSSKIPENFSIGVATAAYQIEGAWNVDGKGPSMWDTFTHNFPDRIANRDNADIACDSYNKFDKDLKALIDLKVNHYRFSIAWTRIMPSGVNSTFNQKGVDYYNYVINKLIEHKIAPMVTMVHGDVPDEFVTLGAMANSEFNGYFEIYAHNLFRLFGDRVKTWITFNEPIAYCMQGYESGYAPPLIKMNGVADYLCIQNTLKAHALAYRLYKRKFYGAQKGRVGITLSTEFFTAKNGDFALVDRAMQYVLGILAHPIFGKDGGYPELIVKDIENNSIQENRGKSRLPQLGKYWRDLIKGSADFIGINYYSSLIVEEENPPTGPIPSYQRDERLKYSSDPSWNSGKGLEGLLKYIRDEYDNVEVVITENGFSDSGDLLDKNRVEYLRNHIQAVLNAVAEGCNVTGYTAWSLMDNFEWFSGFSEKYGIHHIDFKTEEKERKPKLSAKFFTKLNTDRMIPPADFQYY